MRNPPAAMPPDYLLGCLVNHIALPPQLPGKQEDCLYQVDEALRRRLENASITLRDSMKGDFYDLWDNVRYILHTCGTVNVGGNINKANLMDAFSSLNRRHPLVLHVAEQNAGLLIERKQSENGDIVVFEAFEASPLSEQVLKAEMALQWDFPGEAVVIPHSTFSEPAFQECLASFLERSSTESIKRFGAHIMKSGVPTFETRDTADPSLITGMLMTFLEANGHRGCAKVLRKRVRDDVCCAGGGEKPWRRSAFWLVMRVGVQRYIREAYGDEEGRVHYKFLLGLVISQLLRDALHSLSPELLMLVKAKLSRRLAKLEVDRDRCPTTVCSLYDTMFLEFTSSFQKTLRDVNNYVDAIWTEFKQRTLRPVEFLPRRARPFELSLSLPNSEKYLAEVLQWHRSKRSELARGTRAATRNRKPLPENHFTAFAEHYYRLSDVEMGIETTYDVARFQTHDPARACSEFAGKIKKYLGDVTDLYDGNPEQKSVMLLCVMKQWVLMDICATQAFSLLKEFNPGMTPEILDSLHFSYPADLSLVQNIQEYLQGRWAACNYGYQTIFDDPSHRCFAERYYDEYDYSRKLHQLHDKVKTTADRRRREKQDEWEKSSYDFEELGKEIGQTTCLFTTDGFGTVVHDDRKCRKCYLQRRARKKEIHIYEEPLPEKLVDAKAMIFEFGGPEAFRAYRDATWMVIGTLGRSTQPTIMEPRLVLHDYSETKPFMKYVPGGVTLASTSKSSLSTHYRGIRFPVDWESVCHPNNLRLKYFDTVTRIWPARQWQKASFAPHCQLTLSKGSPLSPLFVNGLPEPSSYEIMANQTNCPSSLNLHEFTAYQTILSGKTRRWISLLVELGSANLNFSTEATASLVSHLASQVGPPDDCGDHWRVIHKIFRDGEFSNRLLEQVERRLDSVSSNWRETNCMGMLLTLILKLCSLCPQYMKGRAAELLEKARSITLDWIGQLRTEIHTSRDAPTAERCSRYAFLAALLCRRTFALFAEKTNPEDMQLLPPTALHAFVECSVTMQDNMVSDPRTLNGISRTWLINDLKMAYRMQSSLRESVKSYPMSLGAAISKIWPQPADTPPRSYAEFEFLNGTKGWVQLIIPGVEKTKEQVVLYDFIEGHLLVDGEPLGKLPADHRKAVVLQQLFGDQTLLTYPSHLPGMTYRLAYNMFDNEIHFGFRNKTLIVQAYHRGTILELIPAVVFGNPENFDLPAALVHDRVHWLDLKTTVMVIRSLDSCWKSKPSDWRLDFQNRTAERNRKRDRRGSMLVDPKSRLFQRIACMFHQFEHPSRLTVFQPEKGVLSVESRRLELSFYVNQKHLLECPQLKSEIDPSQDAGTWYGLDSKLVLRDTSNNSRRVVLVPMGPLICTRYKFHVAISIEYSGTYGKFVINDVLGRLDCAAEPWLLFMKAKLHAYTSFVLPDPLTGRTGTEEALHCLKSGYCQPWAPLGRGPLESLLSIAKLTPKRTYYPSGLKQMQQVLWNSQLTTTIQHDAFWPVVDQIIGKSLALSKFTLIDTEIPTIEPPNEPILRRRAYCRRFMLQRLNSSFDTLNEPEDLVYESRDHFKPNTARRNVFETVTLVRNWPSKIHTTTDIAGILQNWAKIKGYDGVFDKIILSDLLDVDFASEWGPLANLCLQSEREDMYNLMFKFAIMSFRRDAEMDIVRSMVAFAVLENIKQLTPPKWVEYTHFRFDQNLSLAYLKQLISPCCVPCPSIEIDGLILSHKSRRQREADERAHAQDIDSEITAFAEFLFAQWPCQEPKIEGRPALRLIDVPKALDVVRPEWLCLFQNLELSEYLKNVQCVLKYHNIPMSIEPPRAGRLEQHFFQLRCRGSEIPELSQDLVRKPGPDACLTPDISSNGHGGSDSTDSISNLTFQMEKMKLSPGGNDRRTPELRELGNILEDITNSQSTVQQEYGRDMIHSLSALEKVETAPKQTPTCFSADQIANKITDARQDVEERLKQLKDAFEQDNAQAEWLKSGGLWPCTTPVTILEQLRSSSTAVFGSRMKECLVVYGLAITVLQRLLRLQDALLKGNDPVFQEEIHNLGHANWNPSEHPDWLLLEIDSNMLIRPVQVDVALATIAPTLGSNSVLQMNMGQGKTSCIMPMVAAELADTTKLLRLIVPKALLFQAAQLLQSRLGGLIGREIRHVPFSRKTPTDSDMIKTYLGIHKDIMNSRSVILTLPEHIMSFKLSGLQRLSDSRVQEAKPMIKIQNWMHKVCRDVLDECDFTLATRTQLIYPSGSQTTVDGHPHRWETAEELLYRVESHLWNLERDFPESVEVIHRCRGRFPTVFFLRRDVEDALLTRLVKDVVRGQTSMIPVKECSQSDRVAIKSFISNSDVPQPVTRRIGQMFPNNASARQSLYLLRGLLVHRILLLTLKKRWNVQYGLHPNRDPIAVPFHAKGVPSDQAEWGHPDVAILFTCLSFYFGGLELSQLRQSLELLVKSDDPSNIYERWIQNCDDLPDVLRDWNVINVDDEAQLADIWRYLRYQVVVIDYFLNHFVFPRHAKQFQVKLQASGWDIPLYSPGNRDPALTTGFSGTNDNRTMLPLTIKQHDLAPLLHTNAEVLTYLLQPRNRQYVHAANNQGKRLSEDGFLDLICRKKIRILIDAGAVILEMDNLSLAKAWLKIDVGAPAVLFFNSENKPIVLYRHGTQVPLLATPFADNLGDCLVYLDEAHTRGTDLKLPPNAVGALTLGLSQTKDHTVQAAMRLRQLATTQSVVFFSPPEVHQSIIDIRHSKYKHKQIDSSDVISWLLNQTCMGIEQIQPLYYSQGIDFCRRTQAALDNRHFLTDAHERDAYCDTLRQVEKQTLSQLYKPATASKRAPSSRSFHPEIAGFVKELNQRRKHFQDFGGAVHGSALQEVEQEREVAFEIESVREVQKPVRYFPLSFPGLHQDIRTFAMTGRVPAGYTGFEPAFMVLKRTALGLKHGIDEASTTWKLFVSREFSRTVTLTQGRPNDNFIRPINWILWSEAAETALIIIPEEAETLIRLLHDSTTPTHLLTYASPVTRRMLHFNNLTYYTIPPLPANWSPPTWLTIELGILAGRVYFEFDEYEDLCKRLSIKDEVDSNEWMMDGALESPSFQTADGPASPSRVTEQNRPVVPNPGSFTAKPLVFLQEWLALRRKGQDFAHTPMGYVCQNKTLNLSHPFFSNLEKDDTDVTQKTVRVANGLSEAKDAEDSSDEESDVGFDVDEYFDSEYEVGPEAGDDEIEKGESEMMGRGLSNETALENEESSDSSQSPVEDEEESSSDSSESSDDS